MKTTMSQFVADGTKQQIHRRPSKFGKSRRVTSDMVTTARRSVRKANEEARRRRLQGARVQ